MSGVLMPFARPWWLLALLPVALLAWRLWRMPPRPAAWQRAIDAHLLPHLAAGIAPRQRRLGLALLGCGLALAVLALAGPLLPGQQDRTYRRDALRVLAVELSPRVAPQLDQVKATLLDLLRALPDGQTALLVYAGEPYLVVPPTSDADNIARFIPELAVDAMPVPGNRPQPALRMAFDLLQRNAASARDLVWVTADAGSAVPPAPDGVRLSILHAGDGDAVRRLVTAMAGRGGWTGVGRDAAGGADAGYWLALLLLPLAALAFRRGVLMVAAPLLCTMLLAPPPGEARELPLPPALADYQAWRLLQSGKPDAAAQRFADRRWRAAASYRAGMYEQAAALLEGLRDADSLYNRGNALAKLGRFAEAIAAYDAALAIRPKDADATHNRELVLRMLDQDRQPPPRTAAQPPGDAAQQAEREAARVAEQWLRRVPDEPATLLRRKLQIEHRRRVAGQAERAW